MKTLHKKSQLYILTAIFLSTLVFLIVDLPAKTQEGSREPFLLYNNFVSEAPKVINGALYQDRNITADFSDFADKFVYYAGTKNINLSLFYIIVHGDGMTVSNMMGKDVNITTSSGEQVLNSSQQISMAIQKNINVEVNRISYPFDINQDTTDFKLIFMTWDKKNNTEVYVYG